MNAGLRKHKKAGLIREISAAMVGTGVNRLEREDYMENGLSEQEK